MSLKGLKLKESYDSDEDDILNDFWLCRKPFLGGVPMCVKHIGGPHHEPS